MSANNQDIKAGDLFAIYKNGLQFGVCCAYKLHFEDGYFYIGHTECLKSRITQHITILKSDKVQYGFKMKVLTKRMFVCEVIDVCPTVLHANELEINEVNKYWGNTLLLNCIKAGRLRFTMDRHYMEDLRKFKPELAKAIEERFPPLDQYNRVEGRKMEWVQTDKGIVITNDFLHD